MKALKDIFRNLNSVYVPTASLAAVVAPVHPAVKENPDPRVIAKGWEEMAEWLRIGFDAENEKGDNYHGMIRAMKSIAAHINKSAFDPDAPKHKILLPREDLRVLRASYWQVSGCANGLRTMAKHQKKRPDLLLTTDENGTQWTQYDYRDVIAIYNRPDANHAKAALMVEECGKRLDKLFADQCTRPANETKVREYAFRRY